METLINILIGIGVLAAWTVINALMMAWVGRLYYHITGVVTVIALLLLFILPQPYLAYACGIFMIVGISNVMVGDVMREDGTLKSEEHWT